MYQRASRLVCWMLAREHRLVAPARSVRHHLAPQSVLARGRPSLDAGCGHVVPAAALALEVPSQPNQGWTLTLECGASA
jgi:hypothetical protein